MAAHYLKKANAMRKKRKPLQLDKLRDLIKLSEAEMKKKGGFVKDYWKKEDRIVNWVTEILPQ